VLIKGDCSIRRYIFCIILYYNFVLGLSIYFGAAGDKLDQGNFEIAKNSFENNVGVSSAEAWYAIRLAIPDAQWFGADKEPSSITCREG